MNKVKLRREQVYNYIVKRINEGYAPTVREICKDLDIKSTSTVHTDIHYLIEQGLIEMDSGRNRAITLSGSSNTQIPVLGTVTAGLPILATENIECYLPVNLPHYDADDLFALKVKGDSMINAAILDGDIVVVEKTAYVENGTIAVALIEDEATVKRFYKVNNSYRLEPENENYPPIITDTLEILGRVVSVVRYY